MTNTDEAMAAEVLAGKKHSKKQHGDFNVACRGGLN